MCEWKKKKLIWASLSADNRKVKVWEYSKCNLLLSRHLKLYSYSDGTVHHHTVMAFIVVRDLRGAIVVRLSLNGSVGGRFCTKLPFWWLLTLYPEHLLPDMLSQSPRLPIKQNIEGRRKSDINPKKKGIFLQIKTLSRKCRDKSAIKAHLILSGTWRDCYSTAEIARGDRRSAQASLFPRPLAPFRTLYL